MAANTRQQVWYDFVIQQMAAESFLDDIDKTNEAVVRRRLRDGSNDSRVVNESGGGFTLNTRMTDVQTD